MNKKQTTKSSPLQKSNDELSAYYKAVLISKRSNNTLRVSNVILVLALIGYIVYSQNVLWVALPGQKLEVSSSFTDPYVEYDAEKRVTDFVQNMFSFYPDNYERATKEAQAWATEAVYQKYYEPYYVKRNEETNQPIYLTYLELSYVQIVQIASQIESYQDSDGNFIVEFEFTQTLSKIDDLTIGSPKDYIGVAKVAKLPYANDGNKTGMVIIDMIIEPKEAE